MNAIEGLRRGLRYCNCLRWAALAAAVVGGELGAGPASADEGGVSFWLPGQFGSLIAVPAQPGWSLGTAYYHTSVDAGANTGFQIGGGFSLGLESDADLVFVAPAYVFATPVLGGQAALSMAAAVGNVRSTAQATLTTPGGVVISGKRTDDTFGFGDLYPLATLKWNMGVNNFMVYAMGDIPVGEYDPTSLANIGIGHGAIDGGGAYTYFDPTKGHEFSAALGLTYNFENPDTNYQNGIDIHLDWAASQFLSPQLEVGVVGYFYGQLTADDGSLPALGDVKSSVIGVGPQVAFLFPFGGAQGYLNLKGHYEFYSNDRPDGWNLTLTFSVQPAAPHR
jgi:hypothetical protein